MTQAEPLSIWSLVLEASLLVQLVMALLFLASVVSWVMIFQRIFVLSSIRRMANVFESEFWSGNDLRSIFIEIESADADPIGIEHLFYSGFKTEESALKLCPYELACMHNIKPEMIWNMIQSNFNIND